MKSTGSISLYYVSDVSFFRSFFTFSRASRSFQRVIRMNSNGGGEKLPLRIAIFLTSLRGTFRNLDRCASEMNLNLASANFYEA